jgi:hypothetical protein
VPQGSDHTDRLYEALRVAMPQATHTQILDVIKAIEAFVNYRVMEHLSL